MKNIKSKKYRKEFYFTNSKLDCIVLKWESGFQNFEVFYNNELLQTVDDLNEIKKGIDIISENTGNIYLKMQTNPLSFIIKSGDQFLSNSYIPELKKVNVTTKIISLIAVVCVISGLGEFLLDYFSYYGIRNYLQIIIYWQFYFGMLLLISIRYIKKGYLFLFMIDILLLGAGIIYLFIQFMDFLDSFSPSNILLGTILFGIGIFMLVFMFGNIKAMYVLHKNRLAWRNVETTNEEILDDF